MNTTEDLPGFEARLLTELRTLVEPAAEAVPAPSRPMWCHSPPPSHPVADWSSDWWQRWWR